MVIGCIKLTHCCHLLTLTCHFVIKHKFDIMEWALVKGKDLTSQIILFLKLTFIIYLSILLT